MNWIQKGLFDFLGFDKLINPIYFESYSNDFVDPITDYNDFSDDLTKLKAIFTNPAALKVFSLQCDLFSLGEVYVYQNGEALDKDPFLDLIKKPNPFQQRSQFLWDFMFWKMLGSSYCYVDSKIVTNESNKMYFLDSSKMQFPVEMMNYRDKIVLSNTLEKAINNFNISYNYADGTSTKLKWGNIIHTPDLSNGIGNWFGSKSKVDALYKIITNSEKAIDSKNINVRYAGKYMIAGQSDPADVTKLPLGEAEKNDIETKMNGRKAVHAVKSMIDIKRFVENASIIEQLDKSYLADYFLIGSEYGIPKDVLEAYNSSTFENQEKARGAHVSYTLSPAGNQLMNAFADRFNYEDKTIVIDWEHLPFMQVFAKERALTEKTKTESLLNLMKAGVPIDDINKMLDTEFSELDYESAQRSNQGAINQDQVQNGQ